jgi:hypothetical protein
LLNFFKALVVAVLGVALGLAATFVSVEHGLGFGAVRAGPWTAWPRSGAPDADPYARAALARSGELPLGLSEGLTFIAAADSAGAALKTDCAYEISGAMPVARFWTLTASSATGGLIGNAANRYGFTSTEILREARGAFVISAARGVQPGNWLPLGGPDGFVLTLRVYDTPVSATASALRAASLPLIKKMSCT